MPSPVEHKLKSLPELKAIVRSLQAAGRRVVFANGCFDLVHVGHVRYLEGARAQGDVLVVGINSDASVTALKGNGRPILPEAERAEIVASMACVDYVVIFDAPTADAVLLELRPDVHAKGTDYTQATVPERATVLSYGGVVAIVGDAKAHATRDLIRTVLEKLGP
jgi:rfaE bifunctional protein nucleotidyltransferase chain/domain